MIVYYLDENGQYYSIDRTKRYSKLTGRKAYEFKKSHPERNFVPTSAHEEIGVKEYVESDEKTYKNDTAERRHRRYIAKQRKNSGYEFISISQLDADDDIDEDGMLGEEMIADVSSNTEDLALHNIDIEHLRCALKKLTPEEMFIINAIFYCEKPIKEKDIAKVLDISQQRVNKKKASIINKLKKYLI